MAARAGAGKWVRAFPALGASDPQATVSVEQADMHTDVLVTTNLPHVVLKHRMDLLIGAHWTLRDVKAA